MKTGAAKATAKIARTVLRLLGKGATTLPGKLALRIDPNIISKEASGKN
ncbi:MAG TPA: DUF1727 domain-containing protein, partial [Clostridiales bacterium]|nr:DUF1727 domain-containing protein [Clostridiales bacterium]